MKLRTKFSALAMVALFTVGFASADTMQLGSYGTYNSDGSTGNTYGNTNTAITYTGYTGLGAVTAPSTTTDLSSSNGSGQIWTAALPNSSWVSYGTKESNSTGPNSYPNGYSGPFPPNGVYTFKSTFTDSAANTSDSYGYLQVMADDTVSVWLNGNNVLSAYSGSGGYPHCAAGTPNCVAPVWVSLAGSDFVSGLNTLTFQVQQDAGYYMGFDASGEFNPVPEPGTLLLFGTGLVGLAFALFSSKRRTMHKNTIA